MIKQLANAFQERKIKIEPHEWIYRQGATTKNVYYIKEGYVELNMKIPGVKIRKEIEEEYKIACKELGKDFPSRNLLYGNPNFFVRFSNKTNIILYRPSTLDLIKYLEMRPSYS